MDHPAERREYLRAQLSVFFDRETPDLNRLAHTIDISERGLHFVQPFDPIEPEAKEVNVSFRLPADEQPIHASGRVVYDWKQGFIQKTAIEFVRLSSGDAERIRRYVFRRNRADRLEKMRLENLSDPTSADYLWQP